MERAPIARRARVERLDPGPAPETSRAANYTLSRGPPEAHCSTNLVSTPQTGPSYRVWIQFATDWAGSKRYGC